MPRRSTWTWIVLLALAVASLAVGTMQLLTGATWQAFDTTGLTIEQLTTQSPDAVRLAHYAVRMDGLHVIAFGVALVAVILGPYRAGHAWAWRLAWALPAAALGFAGLSAAYGAIGPATSATVLAVVASVALALDRGGAAAP